MKSPQDVIQEYVDGTTEAITIAGEKAIKEKATLFVTTGSIHFDIEATRATERIWNKVMERVCGTFRASGWSIQERRDDSTEGRLSFMLTDRRG